MADADGPLPKDAGDAGALRRSLLRTRQRLREQTTRLDLIFDHLGHGMSLFDRRGRLVRCNQRYLDIYRLPAELGRAGVTFRQILKARIASNSYVGNDPQAYLKTRLATVREGRRVSGVHRLNSGTVIAVEHQPTADGGWISTHQDITELHEAQTELSRLAYHDALTGLPNREQFYQRMHRAFAELAQTGGFAVLCLDLDGFKPINDTLGHATGDTLLRQFAGRLEECLGPGDVAARMGGDEFAVLIAGDGAAARRCAERIAGAMLQPFEFETQVVSVAASIGIAAAPADGGNTDAILHSADLALYAAKREKRGGIKLFDPVMDRAVTERRRMEKDLRRALEEGELELFYQPILNLKSQQFSGFEALIRWRHPERGLISPGVFIPMAEEAGLIVAIGEWALREAFAEAARWPADLRVAVNVSSIQLTRGNLLATVMNALASSQIAPGRVEIEITESVFLDNSAANLETLSRLKALGVRIALDDFGTGFSALSYLLAFPFDKIKIDGSFVRALSSAARAHTIVQSVSEIGQRLGMSTTAEGIETPEQLRNIHAAGYIEAQGYLISRPMERNRVRQLLFEAFDSMPTAPMQHVG